MFKSRIKILLLISAFVGAALVGRLANLQVRRADHFRTELETRREPMYLPIPANRGRILARTAGGRGTAELVTNRPAFELGVLYPAMKPDGQWVSQCLREMRKEYRNASQPSRPNDEFLRQELDRRLARFWSDLAELIAVPPGELEARCRNTIEIVSRIRKAVEARHGPADYPLAEERLLHPIATDLTEADAVRLRMALVDQPWAVVLPSRSRVYCRGQTLCHLLGRSRALPGSARKTSEKQDHDYLPGEVRGISGLELACETQLKGHRGWAQLADPPQREVEPVDGHDILLTIDLDLQEYVEELLEQRLIELRRPEPEGSPRDYPTGAAAVVLDLRDQSLLALASVPRFDPARYGEEFEALKDDYKGKPMFNRALMGQYPPGSIIKPAVAQIALDRRAIGFDRTFTCEPHAQMDPSIKAFRCWQPAGHGTLDVVGGIAHSCDIFFYHVGQAIGAERLAECYRIYGLGAKPPGTFGDEAHRFPLFCYAGRVPTPEWVQRRHQRGMSVGDAWNMAIGQGDLLVTPLQAAVMLSALLTDELRPVRLIEERPNPPIARLNHDARALRLVREGMDRVINDRSATAYEYAHSDRVRLAGKTGSAEADLIKLWKVSYTVFRDGLPQRRDDYAFDRQRFVQDTLAVEPEAADFTYERVVYPTVADEEERESLAHAWFMGYAPADRPRVAVVVLIEYGMAGGSAAGPVFRDIAHKCLELGYLN